LLNEDFQKGQSVAVASVTELKAALLLMAMTRPELGGINL